VFAEHPGAVAAPTAGLHFTPELLRALEEQGIGTTHVTLHVGVGTFAPITTSDPRDHLMEREYYRITAAAAEAIRDTRRGGGRILAVGTTVVRT
jgi:S-adenosylmethionine:tRNA ribosyltransferase-isomerase